MVYGIIGAMDSEIRLLTSKMTDTVTEQASGLTFYKGVLGAHEAVVVKCGVGKVNAAACTQALIDRYKVDRLINVGVAGGVSSTLRVLDVVVGSALVHHDFDLRPFGYVKGYLGEAYGGDPQSPTYLKADESMVAACERAAVSALGEEHACYVGIIASGDEFVAAAERRVSISSDFGALASEMEGAAVAQIAAQNGVPFLVLRTISDLADGSAPVSFETVVQFAADIAASVILEMLRA